LAAATFLPWINRLEMSGDLDQRVIEMALSAAEDAAAPLAVNLSVGALVEPAFLHWLDQTLSTAGK
ncbi:MAG TPA: GGDEF domain-containing protein, partial [Halieaceae bacterium]|nr:GGDEF domain-containing protein [Halieaceae bacterium]